MSRNYPKNEPCPSTTPKSSTRTSTQNPMHQPPAPAHLAPILQLAFSYHLAQHHYRVLPVQPSKHHHKCVGESPASLSQTHLSNCRDAREFSNFVVLPCYSRDMRSSWVVTSNPYPPSRVISESLYAQSNRHEPGIPSLLLQDTRAVSGVINGIRSAR